MAQGEQLYKIKNEWCDTPSERAWLFRVANRNEKTRRVYIEPINSNLPFPPRELVSEEMIEKA